MTQGGCASLLRKLAETCALNLAQGMERQLWKNTWTSTEQNEDCMLLVPPQRTMTSQPPGR